MISVSFLGLIVFVTILIISFVLTLKMKTRQEDQLAKKDSRLQKIIETLANLKIIKLQVGQILYLSTN